MWGVVGSALNWSLSDVRTAERVKEGGRERQSGSEQNQKYNRKDSNRTAGSGAEEVCSLTFGRAA